MTVGLWCRVVPEKLLATSYHTNNLITQLKVLEQREEITPKKDRQQKNNEFCTEIYKVEEQGKIKKTKKKNVLVL